MRRSFRSTSPEATEALGEHIGRLAPCGTVLTLDGDLGAGKTTLVRGIARGLGLGDDVSSPTYILMQAHEGGRLPLYHFDAWMEGREKALLAEGADEFLGHDGLAVVEWADRVEDWLPLPRLAVVLAHVDPETRRVDLRLVAADRGEASHLEGALEGLLAGIQPSEGLEEAPGAVPAPENS